jgi:hypothetical protein
VFHVFVVHQSIGINQQCVWCICNTLSIGIQMCQVKQFRIELELLKCPWITSCIISSTIELKSITLLIITYNLYVFQWQIIS